MATRVDLLRPSRDGDQFHYSWAARRCLAMLGHDDAPVAITVEGVPADELAGLDEGVDAIDVGEYFGAAEIADATRIRYLQLKHSTRNPDLPWTLGGIKRTIRQFAERHAALVNRFGRRDVARRFTFEFLTNRPIDSALASALALLQEGRTDATATRLAKAIGLTGKSLKDFAARLRLTGGSPDYLGQRGLLERETSAYLPDRDSNAVLRLSQMVARRATSEYAGRPEISRLDVLDALGASERELFPAPNLIEAPPSAIDREQLPSLVADILSAPEPVILRAEGGVGKSVLTTRIGAAFPSGSETFVYDCFGSGGYQGTTGARHRARDGLVQLANEMATRGLCDPLIPSQLADTQRYFRAFLDRVEKAAAIVAARGPDAILALVIDAADNAEMAALDAHDGPSFARLLLRETWPDAARVVLTCRPERVPYLHPPAAVRQLNLLPFSETETARFLRAVHARASEQDVREFHRLTSHNPRVQQTALSAGGSLGEVLRRLGPSPLTVDKTIEALLDAAVAHLRDGSGTTERARIDRVFTALATLRPFVPLAVVAASAEVPIELVRSIAHDLSHPLLVRDDSVQFRDEPAETWFRKRFRPEANDLSTFVERLRPLASSSAYVASSLPQLMLAAGRFDELVSLALADADLPEGDLLARRDIQLQRLQFAIKAAIRAGRNADAAALGMKAGREAAADTRQQRMLSEHGDLAGRFLEADQMLQQVSRGLIEGGDWTGSRHAYEAAFLSTTPTLHADARSVLRLAMEWLNHWADLPAEPRAGKQVRPADIAALVLASVNLQGPQAGAAELRRWRRREVSFAAGRIVAARLVDAARFDELDELARTAGNDIGLILALCLELGAVGRSPPREAVARALRIAQRPNVQLRACSDWQGPRTLLAAVTALVEAGLARRTGRRGALARLLGRYLPRESPISTRDFHPGIDTDRPIYLRAYALEAALRGRALTIERFLKPPKSGFKGRSRGRAAFGSDDHEARQILGALIPWHELGARARLQRERVTAAEFDRCLASWQERQFPGDRERSRTADEVAQVWSGILDDPRYGAADWQALMAWRAKLGVPLFIPTEIALARRMARRVGMEESALALGAHAFGQMGGPEDDAESQIDTCVSIARALLPLSAAEARAYFDRAVTLSSRVGQENVPSWEAMLDLGAAAIAERCDLPELAYRFARAAELTYAHCARDKHFDWERTLETLAGLSPGTAAAQFARWVDRGFASEPKYLASLAGHQLVRGDLKPAIAAALEAFQGSWRIADLIVSVLAGEPGPVGEKAAGLLTRHARLERISGAQWREIIAALEAHGCDTAEARAGLAAASRAEQSQPTVSGSGRARTRRSRSRRNYARLFQGLDLLSANDLAVAQARLRKGAAPFAWREFYTSAMALVPAGQEARFIDALADGAPPRVLGLRDLFGALPDPWIDRASVPPALCRLVRQQVRAESRRIFLDRHYGQLPWTRLEEVCGLTRHDVAREAVAATGDQSDPLGSDDLFQLVSLLAALMTPREAQQTMDRALALYEPLFEEDAGDGPFAPALVPSPAPAHPWAGYIWAALASPEAARRWRAAHTVRTLATLGETAALADLVALASAVNAGAYADASLHFYGLHARLWLLIALARAAEESPHAVAPFAAWIETFTVSSEPHLLARSFAARALMALAEAQQDPIDPARRATLEAMIAGTLPPAAPAAPSALASPNVGQRVRRAGKALRGGFLIDHDFQRGEVPGLALALGVDDAVVAAEMENVIAIDWSLPYQGRWNEDARARRRLYPDHDHYRGRGETRYDDLSRYLSFQAFHVAAGKLLSAQAGSPTLDPARFRDWLREEGLTRAHGRWRADRRDPVPLDLAAMPAIEANRWPASATDSDAERHVFPARGWITVDARFSRFSGERREQVRISSALVTPGRARALARAMRAHPDPWGAEVPEFGDPIAGSGAFRMEGWITRAPAADGLDRHDPWAAELVTGARSPGLPFLAALGLTPDSEFRSFRSASGGIAMRAEQWSDGIDGGMVRYGGGIRLLARRTLLDDLIRRSGRSLLIHVRVERDLVELRHSLSHKDADDARTVTQIFLHEPGNAWWRPGSGPAPRRRARRAARTR